MSVHHLLVTGTELPRLRFWELTSGHLNHIECRESTDRYTCRHGDLDRTIEKAKACDVTLQEIVSRGTENPRTLELPDGVAVTVSEHIEEYPVLHLGTHGMKWDKAE